MAQLFSNGFFHGDPHPGNIMFLPGNRVGFLDFGIFGALTDEERENVAGQIESLAVGNLLTAFRFYARQTAPTEDTDPDKFRADCLDVLKRWNRSLSDTTSPVEERHLARYTGEMIDVSRRNALVYDLNYLLFWRAINNLNATLWQIKPDYDLIADLRSFFIATRPDPLDKTWAAVRRPSWRLSVGDLLLRAPQHAETVLRLATRNQPTVAVTVAKSAPAQHRDVSETRVGGWLLLSLSACVLLVEIPMAGSVRLAGLVLLAGCVLRAFRWAT